MRNIVPIFKPLSWMSAPGRLANCCRAALPHDRCHGVGGCYAGHAQTLNASVLDRSPDKSRRGSKLTSKTDKATEESTSRPVRADAQRNIDTLLRTALAVFDSSGVDAPVREIAQKAGVGVGTIYRHFPRRSDLIVAVLRNEVDACAETGTQLAAKYSAAEALIRWVDCYVDFVTARRGLAASLSSDDPAFKALAPHFQERLRPVVQSLLDAAIASGQIRKGIKSEELLCGVGALCTPAEYPQQPDPRRMVALFIDGLRYGASR
ncbi:TetR/AcrR family transcriptional regulator [Ralstonia solanacearum]|uniref:TetR/AcrR family transcriptional regulator n=1 Tax=Ralstonia solanacearum TaxID=305 RepID=UPI003518EF2C